MKLSKNLFNIAFMVMILISINSCTEESGTTVSEDHSTKTDHADHEGHDHAPAKDEHAGHDHEESAHSGDHEEEGLHFTADQIKTVGLMFGDFSEIKLNEYVKTTGMLGLPPNAFATVTPKTAGIITGNKKYVEGDEIKKGAIIGFIENPEIIQSQQDFLEARAMLKLKKLDLERQRTLISADAGVSKDLQSAEVEVEILEAQSNGLQKKLNYLGISTDNLTASNIKQQLAIYAPMSGFISSINLHQGMYAQQGVPLMQIISDDHIHLELDIFEKDIANIKVGQEISYSVPSMGSKLYEGAVSVIGKEFDPVSKTIRVHGHLEGNQPPFYKDLFVNAKIWLNDHTTTALPTEAVVQEGVNYFIYAAKYDPYASETFFEKYQVIPGKTDNGYTAVKLLTEMPEGMKVVTKGAYFVFSQSIVGEIEHNH